MNNFFSKIQNAARRMRLSTDEKQRMRVALYEAMKQTPHTEPVPSPLRISKSPYVFLSPLLINRFGASALAVVLILMLGTGTAYAAQGALPGSPLYPVKVGINEPVSLALAQTPQAKAQVNADIAQTRLQEAEALAEQGQLTASTSAELAANFDAHAQEAQTLTQDLSAEDPATAAQLSTEFDSTLHAHDMILAELTATSSATTSEASAALALRIRAHENEENSGEGGAIVATATAAPRMFAAFSGSSTAASSTATSTASTISTAEATGTPTSTETTTEVQSGTANTEQTRIAEGLETRAQAQLTQTQAQFDSLKNSLSASTSAQIEARLNDLNARLAVGTAALSANDANTARANFTAALGGAVTLSAYLTAGQSFHSNNNLLPALLQSSGKGKGSKSSDSSSNQDGDDSGEQGGSGLNLGL